MNSEDLKPPKSLEKLKMRDEIVPMLDDSIVLSSEIVRNHNHHNRKEQLYNHMLSPSCAITIGVCFLTMFCIIVGVTIFILTQFIKTPEIRLTGELNGNMTANLGSFGNITVYPHLDINMKVTV